MNRNTPGFKKEELTPLEGAIDFSQVTSNSSVSFKDLYGKKKVPWHQKLPNVGFGIMPPGNAL